MPPPALTDSAWVDILPPEAPAQAAGAPLLWSLTVFLLLACLTGILWYRHQKQARTRLRHVLRELRSGSQDSKAVCAEIMQYLRDKRVARHLKHWSNDPAWQQYLSRLEACRYSAETIPEHQAQDLVQEALTWLNRKRPPA